MSSFLQSVRGFARGSSKTNNQPKPVNEGQSPTGFGQASPSQSSLNPSPVPSPSAVLDNPMNQEGGRNRQPFFFREQYANLIVKGNFMTLAAKPVLIEEGEWLAHQVVEQNRLLDGMLKIAQEVDRTTGLPICNIHTCPSMTAGPTVTYTWLDANKNSVRVPAPQYIAYVQRWVTGKVTDPGTFPTDPFTGQPPSLASAAASGDPNNWLGKVSGFPSSFPSDIRNIYRQMFRCYAHIYHAHWLDFWHLGAYKELNTCFIHFVNVGRLFGLLNDKDLEPMGPLIDIWLEKGWLPRPQNGAEATQQQQSAGSRTGSVAGAQATGGGGGLQPGGSMGPPPGPGQGQNQNMMPPPGAI